MKKFNIALLIAFLYLGLSLSLYAEDGKEFEFKYGPSHDTKKIKFKLENQKLEWGKNAFIRINFIDLSQDTSTGTIYAVGNDIETGEYKVQKFVGGSFEPINILDRRGRLEVDELITYNSDLRVYPLKNYDGSYKGFVAGLLIHFNDKWYEALFPENEEKYIIEDIYCHSHGFFIFYKTDNANDRVKIMFFDYMDWAYSFYVRSE